MSAPTTAIAGFTQRNENRTAPSQQDIANLAYALWQKRGSPASSGEQDWIEAEQQLLTTAGENSTSNNRR